MLRRTIEFVRGTAIALAICSAPFHSAAAKAPVKAAKATAKVAKPVKAAAKTAKATAKPAKTAAKAKAPAKPMSIEERIASLKPGRFVWQPERSPDGDVDIVVSIPMQIAYVFRGGKLIGATTVSTGQPGYDTPTGSFRILQKRKDHKSNLYDDAPMPFMQRLTWDGVALHGGAIPGHPASHGCVRLPHKFAAALFGVTELGANVMIVDEAPSPEAAYAMAHGRTFESGMGGPEEDAPIEVEEAPALTKVSRTVKALSDAPQ